jgi:hypothetical protein
MSGGEVATGAADVQVSTGTGSSSTSRVLAPALISLGVMVAAASVLGPLALGAIEYHVVDDVLNQVVGGDVVALVLVAPAAVVAGVLTWRGHRAGPVLALGPAGFAGYVYTQLAVGGEFTSVPGNSERFFPLFLALFLLAGVAFVLAWNAVDASELPEPGHVMRRTVAGVLWLVAVFLTFGLHLPGLTDVLAGPPDGIEYTQSPAVFWIVKWMDLGIVVPAMVVTAVGVTRRAAWAARLAYAVIGWGALLGSAVAAMAVVMVVNGDPAASSATAAVFVVFAAALLALTGGLVRPLFARGPTMHDGRVGNDHRSAASPTAGATGWRDTTAGS